MSGQPVSGRRLLRTGWFLAFVVGLVVIASAALAQVLGPVSEGATIVVTSTPVTDVAIRLDGEQVAQATPVVLRPVAPGQHLIEGRARNQWLPQVVDVNDGESLVVTFALDPEPGGREAVGSTATPAQSTATVSGRPTTEGASPVALATVQHVDAPPETAEMPSESGDTHVQQASSPPRRSRVSLPPEGVCNSTGAELSVFVKGQQDCRVLVAGTMIGVTPFFRQPAPIGDCEVTVLCPAGRTTQKHRLLPATHTRVVLNGVDWLADRKKAER